VNQYDYYLREAKSADPLDIIFPRNREILHPVGDWENDFKPLLMDLPIDFVAYEEAFEKSDDDAPAIPDSVTVKIPEDELVYYNLTGISKDGLMWITFANLYLRDDTFYQAGMGDSFENDVAVFQAVPVPEQANEILLDCKRGF
jgi:hypothetical protein